MLRRSTLLLLLGLLVLSQGCPDASQHGGRAPVETCESPGQVCRFAPGQLGVCTPRGDGIICQSQH